MRYTFIGNTILLLTMVLLTSLAIAQNEPESRKAYLLETSEPHEKPMDSLFESILITDERGNPIQRDRLSVEDQTMLFGAAMSVKSFVAVDKDQDVADIDLKCSFGNGLAYCEIPGYFCFLSIQEDSFGAGCGTCGGPQEPACLPDILWP